LATTRWVAVRATPARWFGATMDEHSGKVYIVTGGAAGIGSATCDLLRNRGGRVVPWDLVPRDGDPEALRVDVTDSRAVADAVSMAVEREGALDGVVNCAALFGPAAKLADLDLDVAERILRVNLLGAMTVMQATLPTMLARRAGSIVNVASTAALHGLAGRSAYAASKAALLSATRSVAQEVAARGVRVNAVCPGTTRTRMLDSLSEHAARELQRGVPMGRFGEPAEVADAIAYLLSDRASYATGQALVIDGGASA